MPEAFTRKRTLFLVLTVALINALNAQSPEGIGMDDSPILNEEEASLLHTLLAERGESFDFRNKKAAFITGSSGSIILTKSEYFKNSVLPWIENERSPQVIIVPLTKAEKAEAGGYDVLILSWVKTFTEKNRRKTIKRLGDLSSS